ncbi:MAG TPA: DUF3943 domain-containing protein [Anaeromyxobacteraceae bacterium]|nr:DUF3943 domain-containing protein [Anaeromyxobacteraceae bacterium]
MDLFLHSRPLLLAALLSTFAPGASARAEEDASSSPPTAVEPAPAKDAPAPDLAVAPPGRGALSDRLARLLSDGEPWAQRYAPRTLKLRPPELLELPVRSRETAWLLPIGEKLFADALTWGVARAWGEEWTHITLDTMKRNLTSRWVFDPNDFATNQFGHPYHGHLAFSAWRAAGHEFWESIPFPIVMSTYWELFAETERPSINDGITTPVGGIFLGEVLYRLSSMVIDGGGLHPSGWRLLAAGLVSPPAGLTRALSGNRYRTRLEEPIPAFVELRGGGSFSGSAYSGGQRWATGGLVQGSVQVTHGLPVGDWSLRKPFDHFDFYGSILASDTPWIVLQVRGLMKGAAYGGGLSRGFWGLWGLYDMTTLQPLRASTSAVGFGTTGQWAASNGVALQGTAILATGFGAAGDRQASELTPNYHYGLGGLAILEAKIIAADRGVVRASARQYYVGGLVSPESKGSETVSYQTFGATLRVIGRHAIGLEITRARRWAAFPDRADTFNSYAQAIAYYAIVSDKTMGSGLTLVEQRPP